MKRRPVFLIYSVISIILGVFFLILGWLAKAGLEVDLSWKYLLVFYAGLSLILLVTLLNLFVLARQLLKDQDRVLISQERIIQWLDQRWVKRCLIGIFSVIGLGAGQMLLQIPVTEIPLAKTFLIINKPLFLWLITVSLLSLSILAILLKVISSIKKPDVLIPILIYIVLLSILVGTDLSRFGFANRHQGGGNFRLPGFPVLDYQLILVWILTIAGFGVSFWWRRKWLKNKEISPILIDCLIGAALFLVSFLVWRNAPIVPNAFIDQPRPPNFQYFPNLDAVIYDRTALSLLATGKLQTYIGAGDALWIGRRPLLAVFLAGLHWLSGGDYSRLIMIQLGFFSFMPVLVFLFTKTLHNRISGVLTAGIIIIRNLNGVWLQEDVWGGTSLQMLMSDIPAMMFVVLFLYLGLLWIKNPNRGFFYPLICGAVLGLGMLIRQELVVMLPVIGLVGFFYYRKKLGWLVGQLSLILAGLVVVVTPWIARNYLATGKLYLDKPDKAIDRITETISFLNNESAETGQKNLDPGTDSVPDETEDVPESTTAFEAMANHYANAIPQLFLYLPSNPVFLEVDYLWRLVNQDLERNYGGIVYSPYSYAKSLPYWWWDQWDGKIDLKSWLPLGVNLFLVSAGIYQVWKKERWSVFIPILALIGMISAYVIIRGSGGRWLQTVDWVSAMFFSIGLVTVTKTTFYHQSPEEGREEDRQVFNDSLKGVKAGGVVVFLLLVMIGASPALAEVSLPNKYPASAREECLDELLDPNSSSLSVGEIDLLSGFLKQGGEVLYGRALYPRYFPPDGTLMTLNQTLYSSSTTFTIAGPELNFVVLPRLEPPTWFPQGAETLVIGCRSSSFPKDKKFPCLGCLQSEFEALGVVLYDHKGHVVDMLWRDNHIQSMKSCPMEIELE